MPRTDSARPPRKIREIDKQLGKAGAAPIAPAPFNSEGSLDTPVHERQVAELAYNSEDASLSISIISIFVALFALVTTFLGTLEISVSIPFSLVAVLFFGTLAYLVATDRRAAVAAAAVVQFRFQEQSQRDSTPDSIAVPRGRYSLFSVTINGRSQPRRSA